jgi:hypothetical protein
MNPQIPADILREMRAQGETTDNFLAFNPSCPPDVLLLIAADAGTNSMTRVALAQNPSLPEAIFERLARDSDQLVRAYVALNPSLPPRLYERLEQDPEERVRSWLASNPSYRE